MEERKGKKWKYLSREDVAMVFLHMWKKRNTFFYGICMEGLGGNIILAVIIYSLRGVKYLICFVELPSLLPVEKQEIFVET